MGTRVSNKISHKVESIRQASTWTEWTQSPQQRGSRWTRHQKKKRENFFFNSTDPQTVGRLSPSAKLLLGQNGHKAHKGVPVRLGTKKKEKKKNAPETLRLSGRLV